MINLRVDRQTKTQAQAVSESLGLSLSALINGFLKHLVRTKRVEFELESETPSEYMIQALRESADDYRKGNYRSFKDPNDALKYLDQLIDAE